jgi:DNA-binding transcriptional LysR family regulator
MTLHLGATETYALSIRPKTLSLFSQLHPNIQLSIRCQRSPVLLKELNEGHLDLVLSTDQGKHHNRTLIKNDLLVWVAS